MRRLFWLGAGIAVGVLVMRRIAKTAEALTPRGIGRSASGAVSDLAAAIGEFSATVKAASAERETELRAAVEQNREAAHRKKDGS